MPAPIVSVIMPAFNAEAYIGEAVQSVLDQDFEQWELLIINDGSTDLTVQAVEAFADVRIRLFTQENRGVSAARNIGLANASGQYVCFLDADDRLPTNSLSSRLAVFQQDERIRFADGQVAKWNADFSEQIATWAPSFAGPPMPDLIQLGGQAFFGPTWMIKLKSDVTVRMREGLSHGEDLLFYMELARALPEAHYAYTHQIVLYYRTHATSAMRNLKGLDEGYRKLAAIVSTWSDVPESWRNAFRRKTRTIMVKSFLRNVQPLAALKALV